jgi:hypothetical protein
MKKNIEGAMMRNPFTPFVSAKISYSELKFYSRKQPGISPPTQSGART